MILSLKMSAQPFLITNCGQLGNLFWTGYINNDDKRWNISFTPGVVGSWAAFTKCWIFAWDCIVFAFTGYSSILKCLWEIIYESEKFCGEAFVGIPEGIGKGCSNIGSLIQDAPFGWI